MTGPADSQQGSHLTRQTLGALFHDLGFGRDLAHAREKALLRTLGEVSESRTRAVGDSAENARRRLSRLAYVQERIGLDAFTRLVGRASATESSTVVEAFSQAYSGWIAVVEDARRSNSTASSGAETGRGNAAEYDETFGDVSLSSDVAIALHLAVAGTLAARQAEARLDLRAFTLTDDVGEERSWIERVAHRTATALALLVRKSGGWTDIRAALERIASLRELQAEFEGPFLESQGSDANQQAKAAELVVWYHLAQIVTSVGGYLTNGMPSLSNIASRVDKHRDRAILVTESFGLPAQRHLVDLVWACARSIASSAIWSHVAGLGEKVEKFAKQLASEAVARPVVELWPSQQKALRDSVLSSYHKAVLVEMPTSAGKTLLAKFAIVQAKALNPQAIVVYLAPTRALVNQITIELRQDFAQLEIEVEQTVPAFELDPSEDSMLTAVSGVLVTTPEKLDLLLKRDHPVTKRIALVVADEAHSIGDGTRGARLELLLGMLKRERADARFLLLSPFVPRGKELTDWLGDERGLTPIVVSWQPSNRLVAVAKNAGRAARRRLVLESLNAVGNSISPGSVVDIGNASAAASKSAISEATVVSLVGRGSVLVLCRGAGTSEARAQSLSNRFAAREHNAEVEAVCEYIAAEAGEAVPLVEYLRRGVAYHHAGLSPEVRWLVEGLIRKGLVSVICGTTTLAAGVNFPISAVVVETLQKGDQDLSYADFWNIAGRAGRALVDTLGVVAFPSRGERDQTTYEEFLRSEAVQVASQLSEVLIDIDDLQGQFNMRAVERHPAFGAFLQFLAHALKVAGSDDLSSDVEDLLRSTLVYRQALSADPSGRNARKLISIANAYLADVGGQRGILELADQTGFSTPSVLYLQRRVGEIPQARDRASWSPVALFGQDTSALTARIEAVASIPEIQLGQGIRNPFNAQRIAEILRDWVNGADLRTLAERYAVGTSDESEEDTGSLSAFSKYLFSQLLGKAAWGLGALEGLCLAGGRNDTVGDEAFVPAMVFFGVRRKEAVWLRMVGVPRVLADGLGQVWAEREGGPPQSFKRVRDWVSSLDDSTWASVVPARGGLSPESARRVWRALSGNATAPESGA
jgi:replicative superfamily II helicase